jgi:carbon-monoxide dehydrogenase large subunit|tara:strand:- start:2765 stop:5155 length:2391 start_codon:yes stop_codon:yes gene_type:complete
VIGETRYVGTSVPRREDARLLQGTGRFIDDIRLPGCHHVVFVRSSMAHGILRGIDATDARTVPGVLAVLTGADLASTLPIMAPSKADGGVFEEQLLDILGSDKSFIRREDRKPVAVDRVRHVGEIVAVVVATDPYIAEDAAERVVVDIEPLAAVVDPYAALEVDAPRLYDHWPDNRSLRLHVTKGDIDAAFSSAATVVKRRFHSGRVSASPIEGRGVVAELDSRTTRLTVWSSTQIPHPVRTVLADALSLPVSRIRVVAPDVGGGFGCKAIPYPEETIVAHLAMVLGVAVKWIEDRWEHFASSSHSRDQYHDIELALDADGRILGLRDRFVMDAGAANPLGVVQPYNTIAHLCGCYKVSALDVEAIAVVTNKVPLSPYRGAGRPEAVFAMDRILDVAAQAIGLDPIELRRRNLIPAEAMPYEVGINYRDGSPIVYDSGDFPACFERAVELSHADSERRSGFVLDDGRKVGLGISTYVEGTGVGPFEGALVRVDGDGTVCVAVGACPQGQGHETIFSQIAADVLGLHPDKIHVTTGDTDAVPYGWGTLASRSAVVAGSAVTEAATELRHKMLEALAEDWEIAASDLEIDDGSLFVRGTPSRTASFATVAERFLPGGPYARIYGAGLEAQSYWEPPTVTFAGGVHVARVAVDTETGQTEILDYVVVHDCGPLVNPLIVDGQIAGGVAQGIGTALYEELHYDEIGQPLNPNLIDYLLPSADTVPELVVAHLETPSPLNPLGIKGVGEAGAISPPAAIANAIEDALRDFDVHIDQVPVSPSYVLGRLHESDAYMRSRNEI